jgi:hypothetical protein
LLHDEPPQSAVEKMMSLASRGSDFKPSNSYKVPELCLAPISAAGAFLKPEAADSERAIGSLALDANDNAALRLSPPAGGYCPRECRDPQNAHRGDSNY